MFRIGLMLFKIALGAPGQLTECPSLYETMEKLRNIPLHQLNDEFLAKEVSVSYTQQGRFCRFSFNHIHLHFCRPLSRVFVPKIFHWTQMRKNK